MTDQPTWLEGSPLPVFPNHPTNYFGRLFADTKGPTQGPDTIGDFLRNFGVQNLFPRSHGHECQREYPRDSPTELYGDPKRVRHNRKFKQGAHHKRHSGLLRSCRADCERNRDRVTSSPGESSICQRHAQLAAATTSQPATDAIGRHFGPGQKRRLRRRWQTPSGDAAISGVNFSRRRRGFEKCPALAGRSSHPHTTTQCLLRARIQLAFRAPCARCADPAPSASRPTPPLGRVP